MLGLNFPVSDYYREKIVDARTLSRGGGWWTALLVIADPRSGDRFLGLYRWQESDGQWKTRNRFLIRKKADLEGVIACLQEFGAHLSRD